MMMKFFTRLLPNWSEWSDIIRTDQGDLFQVKFDLNTGQMKGKSQQDDFKMLDIDANAAKEINDF